MPTRIKHEDVLAPLWFLTMGDMSNLLMLLFVALFAMLVMDKARLFQAPGHEAAVQRIPEGTALTLSGEEGSFPEGDWRLNEVQKRMLLGFKKWLEGRHNLVEIRGHTASNLLDSVVLDPDERIRPFRREDLKREDRERIANHSLLAWLRANEARTFLMEAHPDLGDPPGWIVGENRIRIRADAYTRRVAHSTDPAARMRNRRVEVVATSEIRED